MTLNINFDMLDTPIQLSPVTSIVIENPSVFAKLVQNLFNYNEDMLDLRIFDNHHKQLKPQEVVLITDILSHDVNTSTALRLIYNDLESQISQDPISKIEIEDLLGQVLTRINCELIDFVLDLSVNEITLQGAFKALGIKIATSGESIFERVFDIIQIYKYMPKKNLLIFVNLSTYLNPAELMEIVDYAHLQKINMLLLDNSAFSLPPDATQFVLDHDFVLIKTLSNHVKE